jgi:glycine/D-amino acid oxidase-like deaminating enzyme
MHIAIIGSGIVGTCSAAWLIKDGHRVTFVSTVPPGEACSFGNAGSLSPSACLPVGMPGMWKKALDMLEDARATTLYAQAAGEVCDCLCPVPRNAKLNAEDCGALAARLAVEEATAAGLAAANLDATDAAARYADAVKAAHAAADIAGPRVNFPVI